MMSLKWQNGATLLIIGIGNINATEIEDSVAQTGEIYYSEGDGYSMKSSYQKIYQIEKELCFLEFEESTGPAVDDPMDIQVGYHSE